MWGALLKGTEFMSYTISITRKGLVFDKVSASDNPHAVADGSFLLDTEDLANRIDETVLTRRQKMGIQPAAAGLPMMENDRLNSSAPPVDWFQRLVETVLLISFTALAMVYFL